MYTLHFYAGTHGAELRQRIDSALSAGLPIFVSEWGTSRADGSGGVKKAGAGDQGQEYLVVSVDDGYATVRM